MALSRVACYYEKVISAGPKESLYAGELIWFRILTIKIESVAIKFKLSWGWPDNYCAYCEPHFYCLSLIKKFFVARYLLCHKH